MTRFDTVTAAKNAVTGLTVPEIVMYLIEEIADADSRKGVIDALLDANPHGLAKAAHVGVEAADKIAALEKLLADADELYLQARAAAKAAPAPSAPAAPVTVMLGTIIAESESLVVLDPESLDTKWKRKSDVQKGYFIDIEGPRAQYLANRSGKSYTYSQIEHDTWRIKVLNRIQAGAIESEIERLCYQEGWEKNNKVTIYSHGSSQVHAADGARANRGGFVSERDGLRYGVLRVEKNASVPVRGVKGPGGKIVQLIIG